MVCVAILYHVLSCHFEYWWNRCMYCNMFVTFTARLYGMASCGASCKKSNWMWHMEVQCSVLLSDGMLFNVCVIFIAACSQIGMRSCQSNCWKRIQRKMQTTCRHKLQLLFDNCSFETHTHTDTASRSSAINLTRWIHPLLSPEPANFFTVLDSPSKWCRRPEKELPVQQNIDTICYIVFLSVRVRMICCADRDALCTMHLKVPHTHIYIYYTLLYTCQGGIMD